MTAGGVRQHIEMLQCLEHGHGNGADRRLGDIGPAQPQPGFSAFLIRAWIDDLIQVFDSAMGKRILKDRQAIRESTHQVTSHVRILTALPRKEEGERTGRGSMSESDVISVFGRRLPAGHAGAGGLEALFQLIATFGLIQHHRHAKAMRSVERFTAFGRQAGDSTRSARCRRARAQPVDSGGQLPCIVRRKTEDLDRAVPGGQGTRGSVFFQHRVKITPAESESTHAGTAGAAGTGNPGAQPMVQVKRTAFDIQFWIHWFCLQGRRQDFVKERQGGFYDSGRPCGRLCVADVRFDRTQRTPSPFGVLNAENLPERLKFNLIADPGACTVGLHHIDRKRVDAGFLIGPLQCTNLPFRAWGVDTGRFSIARRPDPPDHGINAIAIPFSICESLEYDETHAFAKYRSIRIAAEGADFAGFGQDVRFGKTHMHEHVVDRVHAAGDHHIASARRQFHHRHVDGPHGACAGCVDHAIGPAQVQSIGNSPGDHVSQQPGERVFLPFHIGIRDPPDDGFGLFRPDAGLGQGTPPDGVSQAGAQGNHEFLGSCDADNDAGFPAVERSCALPVSRIGQSRLGGH